jgi:hypothetical protein
MDSGSVENAHSTFRDPRTSTSPRIFELTSEREDLGNTEWTLLRAVLSEPRILAFASGDYLLLGK